MKIADPVLAPTIDSDIVAKPRAAAPERLLSLDVLRGLTIAFMILVNNQIGRHPFSQLSHAAWNGFTATDLVFPTFLFLVGISTVLSTQSRLARGATRSELFLHTTRRALLLIAFGFIVNNFPLFHLASARYYGVLPRIAICYFITAAIYLVSPGWKDKLALAVACLIGYWLLMRFVPVPGFGIPTHQIPINDHDANLTAWIDRHIFSAPHLYERTRDPEGLLSTIPALATSLFGVITALWLRTANSTARKAVALAAVGALFLILGLAWNPYFPINKKLWTSSFTLYAGGWSLLCLAASIAIVDLWRVGRGSAATRPESSSHHPLLYRPLLVFGTNAILAYMVSELGDGLMRPFHPAGMPLKRFIYQTLASWVPNPAWASLVYSLIFVFVCWLLVLPFYRKRIFLRI
ncbi:MAG TPA: heparan-alpha-glucosaminide N-acetyltransferase domain-containing protein [Acidobacteriaceae bacterium]|jgi:predicted acyltransferase|nr:heparan-alpha-glucosaminide N-acetyltransferase domain-containing protein [Acidobacteriaceae bacterium]